MGSLPGKSKAQCALPLDCHYAIMPRMTFICPYCRAETKDNIAISQRGYHGFGRAKCSACGREFLYMPMSMKMEDKPTWEQLRLEAYSEHLKVGVVILISVILIFLSFIAIAYLIT